MQVLGTKLINLSLFFTYTVHNKKEINRLLHCFHAAPGPTEPNPDSSRHNMYSAANSPHTAG